MQLIPPIRCKKGTRVRSGYWVLSSSRKLTPLFTQELDLVRGGIASRYPFYPNTKAALPQVLAVVALQWALTLSST